MTPEKDRSSARCGCKAAMSIKYVKEVGKWKISTLNKEHTHELIASPSKKRLLKSQKYMTDEQKELIKLLGNHGVKPIQTLEILADLAGGRQNLCCSRKDVSNVIAGENRKLVGVDLDSTMIYFGQLQQSDPDFFFAIETDMDNNVKNLYWVNGRSRRSYHEFGDVVVFDTTYSTNKYSMPCAPFVGVNHHRQSIFFGCALIRDEKMSSFEWLFETFLKAMHGKHPHAIMTDQDPSMKGAIAKIFPKTIHRCCQWHVMRKARERLAVLYGQKIGFQKDLTTCINQSMTVQEFEKSWDNMLRTHEVQENDHLITMFNAASQWVPAYFRGTFFADMCSSQRSESMNSLMKKWLDSRMSICNFVIQFEKITAGIFSRESDEDNKTTNYNHNLWTEDKIEEQARDVYTKNVFLLFREIFKRATGFAIRVLEHDRLYLTISQKYGLSYKVQVDRPNFKVSCECKGFEFEGILCSHALKVMQSIGLNSLPSHYVLKRWTREANADVKRLDSGKSVETEKSRLSSRWLATLTSKFNKISIKATQSVDVFTIACAKLDELDNEIEDVEVADLPVTALAEHSNVMDQASKNQPLGDPPISQCKGKRKPQRFKPPAERILKKKRTCSICKKKAGHNASTCPEKIKLKGNGDFNRKDHLDGSDGSDRGVCDDRIDSDDSEYNSDDDD